MEITFSNNAKRSIRKLDKKMKEHVRTAIETIPQGDIKKLIGIENAYRVRIGEYRILYEKTETGIKIIDVLPRGSAYKNV